MNVKEVEGTGWSFGSSLIRVAFHCKLTSFVLLQGQG